MSRMFFILGLAVALVGGCKEDSSKKPGGASLTIAVIPKGTTHEFWKSVESGAKQAGKEFGATIIWKGPLKEDDRAGQIDVVQQFVGDRVSGIVLAPLDSRALLEPVRLAGSQHIPVVIIDSGLEGQPGTDFISFVATDNHKGGEIAAQHLVKLLDGKGTVAILPYAEGSASTLAREAGFMDEIKKHAGMKVVGEGQYGGPTADHAQQVALNMIDTIKQADGIFCSNESNTAGMLAALRTAGITGKARFVGFDSSPQLIDALRNNQLDALVSQDPFKMGYEGVKAMVDHLRGKPVEARVDTGVQLITHDNLDSPAIQALLKKHD